MSISQDINEITVKYAKGGVTNDVNAILLNKSGQTIPVGAKKFALTTSTVNPSYIKSYSVTRSSSQYAGEGSTISNGEIWYGDALSASATAADATTSYTEWVPASILNPTFTDVSDITLKVNNPNNFAVTLHYKISTASSYTSTSINANSNAYLSGTAGATYQCYFTASKSRTKTVTTYSVSKSWTSLTVDGNEAITFTGSASPVQSTETGTLTSSTQSYVMPYKIVLTKNTNIASISLTYYPFNSSTQTTVTTANTYYGKANSAYSWTATAGDYYFVNSSNASGSGTMNEAKTISPTATAGYYAVSITSSNGTPYWGTAANPTASDAVVVQYGSTLHYRIKPKNYYIYGTTKSGSTSADAQVLVNSDNFTFSSKIPGTSSSITSPTATKAYNCSLGYYTIKMSLTNGGATVKNSTSGSYAASAVVQYGQPVYYRLKPNSYYFYTNSGTNYLPSGSGYESNLTVNTSNFTLSTVAGPSSSPGTMTTKSMGSCTAGYYKLNVSTSNGKVWYSKTSTSGTTYPSLTSLVIQYGSTAYLGIRGNTYYYYNNILTGGCGTLTAVRENYTLDISNFTFSSTDPGTSDSITTPTASKTLDACVKYATYKLTKGSGSNYTITCTRTACLATGSTTSTSLSSGATIYEGDLIGIECKASTMYKVSSSSCTHNGSAKSVNTTNYWTTNSSRDGWTTTTSSSSSTGIKACNNYSIPGVSGAVSVSMSVAAMNYTYHGFTTVVSSEIKGNSSTSITPFGNTGVSKLNYYPTNYIKLNGDIHMSSDAYNYDGTVLGGMDFWCSVTHASLSRSHRLYNNSSSTTQPTSIQIVLQTSGGGGLYKSYVQLWGVQVPE